MIKFCLNGRWMVEKTLSPSLTLLRYLRTQHQLTGTKEGCGSGDCGACSVLVGEESPDGQWRYKAVNGCITFLAQLHGKSVITVDGLAEAEQLHPAQQAMVDHHGSQCGFCTPGIVMSLAALHQNLEGAQPDRQQIMDALSGNLCRCTGYRPIIEAAEVMHEYPASNKVEIWQPDALMTAPIEQAGLDATVRNRRQEEVEEHAWVVEDESQLQQLLLENPDARLVAGATDLALEVTQFHKSMHKLIAIGSITTLKAIDVNEDSITIGAAATYGEMEETLAHHYPEFAQLLHRLGSRQVRNHGTLGGNIGNASPIGDTPPVLLALGAEVELVSKNTHRWLPLEAFFLDYKQTALRPAEYIRSIKTPRLAANQYLKVYKISKRIEDDISAVLAAFVVTVENEQVTAVRTGFGGMAAIPKAATHVESALLNQPLSEQSFLLAADQLVTDFSPLSDVRASSAYRLNVAKGLMHKCALELLYPEQVSRIERVSSASLVEGDVLMSADVQGSFYHA